MRLKGGVGTVKWRTAVLNDLRKLLHDPSLTMRGVLLAAVDSLFTATGGDPFRPRRLRSRISSNAYCFLPPSKWSELLILDDLLITVWMGGGSNVACATQRGQDVGTSTGRGPTKASSFQGHLPKSLLHVERPWLRALQRCSPKR